MSTVTASKDDTKSKDELRILPLREAVEAVVKTGEIQTVGVSSAIPIAAITKYENPRHEPENLLDEGYVLIGNAAVEGIEEDDEGVFVIMNGEEKRLTDKEAEDPQYFISLIHMALSDDNDCARQYVELIEQYENTRSDDRPDDSIVGLARSINEYEQLVPIMVRAEKNDEFTGIDGGRRVAAILYLHCKSRTLREDKTFDKHLFKGKTPSSVYPAVILATDRQCKPEDVFLISLKTNLDRKSFSPLQEGKVYFEMLKQINPKTNKKWTMKDAAIEVSVTMGTFRHRKALAEPYNPETKRGLSDTDRQKVATGQMTATAASQKSLGERPYSKTGEPAHNRNKGLPLSAMQQVYDKIPEPSVAKQEMTRLQKLVSDNDLIEALESLLTESRRGSVAECMGLTPAKAQKESSGRIEEQDRKELAAQERSSKKGKKNAKAA